jgi:hypothetical protein
MRAVRAEARRKLTAALVACGSNGFGRHGERPRVLAESVFLRLPLEERPRGRVSQTQQGARSEEPRKWQLKRRPPRRPLDRTRKRRRRSPSDRRRSRPESRRGRSRRPPASPKGRRLRVRGPAPRLNRSDEKGRLAPWRAGLILARFEAPSRTPTILTRSVSKEAKPHFLANAQG